MSAWIAVPAVLGMLVAAGVMVGACFGSVVGLRRRR
jgi:hypothetical protein